MTPIVRTPTLALALLLAAPAALAAPPTKDECVDAHGKGQDARESGQLVHAGKLFLTCAQPSCPELVQRDCARFADELERLTPSVTFAARDGAQNDLLDTRVLVDGAQVASRLGDGKAHEIDPGRHEVRFVHAGKEVVLDVVVSQGEKGRALVGTFPSPSAGGPESSPAALTSPYTDAPEMKRPSGPLVVVGLGAAAAAAGGVLLGIGLAKIPSSCSLATHQCAAPPNDPVFDRASTGVTFVNLGAIVGASGLVALGGSLIWYLATPPRAVTAKAVTARTASAPTTAFTPWMGPRAAGLSFSGSL
jgi:hypothetical protein